jgi:hypothetical protein
VAALNDNTCGRQIDGTGMGSADDREKLNRGMFKNLKNPGGAPDAKLLTKRTAGTRDYRRCLGDERVQGAELRRAADL